jgi:hypothetical protein
MDDQLRRIIAELETIASQLEALVVLKEHELGVRLEYSKEGGGPYVPLGNAEE